MKTSRVLLAALLGLGVAACALSGAGLLSYADVQALNPGASADWVLQEFPFGKATRGEDGKVRQISYRVNDPAGHAQTLLLLVGPDGRVSEKRYSGPVIRPQGGP